MKHPPDRRKASSRSYDLSLALEHSVAAASCLIPQISTEQAEAPERLSELLAAPPPERERLLASAPRFHTYSLVVQALRRAETVVFHRPAPAIELAQLAHLIVSHVPPRPSGGVAALADLKAYTVAMEGNALRVSGDFQGALRLFAVARQIQQDGGADPELMAKIDRLEASLCRDLRQLHRSLRLLDRSAKVFRALKENGELARTLINRANVFNVRRDFREAKALLESACEFAQNPALQYAIKHNLIDILAQSGRPREAARLFKETEELYQEHPDPLTSIRRIWLEGIIVRELRKDLERARELLTEAAARLSEHGYAMDAQFARVDLAMVLRAQAK